MASIVVTRGLLQIGTHASQASGYGSSRFIQTMAVDNSATAFVAGATTLGSPGSIFDQGFDATPSTATDSTSATITHITTYGTANANFTIQRVSLHDSSSTGVTGSSVTLVAGIDAQSLTKTTDFTMAITLRLKYTSV